MKVLIWRALGGLALVSIAAFVAVGCGGSDDTTTETETEAAAAGAGAAGGSTAEIKMGDYYFDPQNATLEAGAVTIEAPNEGSLEHELVLFRTDKNPADLPTEANGGVDEEQLDQEAEEIGEIADVEGGDTKSEEFKLKPGKYVMFCNLPGHYAQGMYGTVTVK